MKLANAMRRIEHDCGISAEFCMTFPWKVSIERRRCSNQLQQSEQERGAGHDGVNSDARGEQQSCSEHSRENLQRVDACSLQNGECAGKYQADRNRRETTLKDAAPGRILARVPPP